MPFTPTRVPRAIDPDVLVDGARAALLANTSIATTLNTAANPKRIANEMIEEGITAPYIVLALASTVYESRYNDPAINVLLDVSAYTEGQSTTTVRALLTACLTALVDTPWTAAGLAINTVTMEESGTGVRQISEAVGGKVVRGRQATIRIHATKTP